MSADPFSDILELTNAETLVTGGFTAGGTWAIRFPAPDKIKFFAVVKGRCWVTIEGERPIHADTGDVFLVVARRSFVLGSDASAKPVEAMGLFSGDSRKSARIGKGDRFRHLGGHILLDPASAQLLADALPPWIHIRAASPQATIFRWLIDQLVTERAAELPGAQHASAQLAQLLFIQILRAHLKTASALPTGWLRALKDPGLAPALRSMHAEPARSWRLDELAKIAAMSRTTFAFHFKHVVGIAPLAYLIEWRMRLAGRALRDDDAPVAAIARSLGYTSESAFSNAFKRVTGGSPRAYRNAHARATRRSRSRQVP